MNLGGMEEIAKEVAGRAMLDHAKETERKLVRYIVALKVLGIGKQLLRLASRYSFELSYGDQLVREQNG